MYLKRAKADKKWPIPRKGSKYIAVATHERKNSIPILLILRDILKLAENRKEAKKIINSGQIIINNKKIKNERFPVLPFDIVKIGDKNYKLKISERGKIDIEETKETDRIHKIIGKKTLKNGKIQFNLLFGENIISNKKIKIGDSIIIKDKSVSEIIPLEENKNAVIMFGKNAGKMGKIEKIEDKKVILKVQNQEVISLIKNIFVIK